MEPFKSIEVDNAYSNYPEEYQNPLLKLRQLIYDTARKLTDVGTIDESLKWNQPSYSSKIGSPIRLDRFGENEIAMLFHCQTTLIETFRKIFKDDLSFSKNRAIVLNINEDFPIAQLEQCIEMALTYHQK